MSRPEDYLLPHELLAYEQAETTLNMLEELIHLRIENEYLKKKVDKNDNMIDEMYKNSIGQMGSLLSGLVDKAER